MQIKARIAQLDGTFSDPQELDLPDMQHLPHGGDQFLDRKQRAFTVSFVEHRYDLDEIHLFVAEYPQESSRALPPLQRELTRAELLAETTGAELLDAASLTIKAEMRFTFNGLPMRVSMDGAPPITIEVLETPRRLRFDVGYNRDTHTPQIAWIGEPNDADLVLAADVVIALLATSLLRGGVPQFQFTAN